MKELFGQAILIIILLCASAALVGSMTGWIDLGRVMESSPLSPTATRPQQSASNSISAQRPAELKTPERRSPEQKAVTLAPAAPAAATSAPPTIEKKSPVQEVAVQGVTAQGVTAQGVTAQGVTAQGVTAPEVKPSHQAVLETGYDQLRGLGRETAGYGLYSYGVLTAPSPRSAAFLAEIYKSIPSAGDAAAARAQLNIFYIPTKKDKVADLAALVGSSRDDQTKVSVRYSEALYDYKMARAILIHLCNPPPKPMTGLCKGPMSGGPYILTNARPSSSLEPVPPPFLFVDLSDISPHAYAEFISAFRATVKQEDATDDVKLHSLRLKVLNLALTATDWTSKVKKSVVDIVHPFDSLPDGQASR